MIQDGYCFLRICPTIPDIEGRFYNIESYYKRGDIIRFNNIFYVYTDLSKEIKYGGAYKETCPGFYEPIMEKFEKVETMQKEKKYTDAEVLVILIEELDKKGLKKKARIYSPPTYFYNYTSGISLYKEYAIVFINDVDIKIYYKEPQSINRILALADKAIGIKKQEEKPKFKVGDRVMINAGLLCPYSGYEGIIKNIRGDLSGYRVEINKLNWAWIFDESDLELIEEEHEPITPENIEEVLKYNGFVRSILSDKDHTQWQKQNILIVIGHIKEWIPYLLSVKIDLSYSPVSNILEPTFDNFLTALLGLGIQPLPKKKKEPSIAEILVSTAYTHAYPPKEPTLEEALIELGFELIGNYGCCHYKNKIYGFILNSNKMQLSFKPIINYSTDIYQRFTYTTKEQLAKDIAAFEEKHKFRPHWSLVDDGGHGKEIGKIYLDTLQKSVIYKDLWRIDNFINLWVVDRYRHIINVISFPPVLPAQHVGKECDFGILCKDGSLIKAFWKGEE